MQNFIPDKQFIHSLLHKHCGKHEIPSLAHLPCHALCCFAFACLKKFCNVKVRNFR